MALLFMESFDGYGGDPSQATKYRQASGLIATGRTGPYCTQGSWERAIFPGSSTLIIGFALHWGVGGSGASQGYLVIGSGVDTLMSYQVALTIDTNGTLNVHTGYMSGPVIGSTPPCLVANSWNFIEYKVTVGNPGSFQIKVNGASVLTGSGNTANQGVNTIGGVLVFPGAVYAVMDDLYVLDSSGPTNNDFIGDCKVECLTPQPGNGSNVGLTPFTGTDHGAMVDELPANDDTDYNSGTTAGVIDTYNFTNLVATTGVVKAVQVTARAKKTDAGTKQLALVARVGPTNYASPSQVAASTTYGQYQYQWEYRPDGPVWSIADVNGAEFGLKVVS